MLGFSLAFVPPARTHRARRKPRPMRIYRAINKDLMLQALDAPLPAFVPATTAVR